MSGEGFLSYVFNDRNAANITNAVVQNAQDNFLQPYGDKYHTVYLNCELNDYNFYVFLAKTEEVQTAKDQISTDVLDGTSKFIVDLNYQNDFILKNRLFNREEDITIGKENEQVTAFVLSCKFTQSEKKDFENLRLNHTTLLDVKVHPGVEVSYAGVAEGQLDQNKNGHDGIIYFEDSQENETFFNNAIEETCTLYTAHDLDQRATGTFEKSLRLSLLNLGAFLPNQKSEPSLIITPPEGVKRSDKTAHGVLRLRNEMDGNNKEKKKLILVRSLLTTRLKGKITQPLIFFLNRTIKENLRTLKKNVPNVRRIVTFTIIFFLIGMFIMNVSSSLTSSFLENKFFPNRYKQRFLGGTERNKSFGGISVKQSKVKKKKIKN